MKGKDPLWLAAGTLTMVPVTCPKVPLASYGVSSGDITARRGCTIRGPVSPAEVASERVVVHVPVTNGGYADVWLPERSVIATVSMVTVLSEQRTRQR